MKFQCIQCGRCCRGEGYVWINLTMLKRISHFLGISQQNFAQRYLRKIGENYSLRDNRNQECIFYDNKKGCLIYPVRPDKCRTFPDWKDLKSKPAIQKMLTNCPGLESEARESPRSP